MKFTEGFWGNKKHEYKCYFKIMVEHMSEHPWS